MVSQIDQGVRNAARGGKSYQDAALRERIATLFLQNPATRLSPISDFLSAQLLGLRPATWTALAFTDRDERVLRRLRTVQSELVGQNYAELVCSYVLSNSRRVRALYNASDALSAHMFSEDPAGLVELVAGVAPEDRQSLFAFRLFGLTTVSSDALVEHFSNQSNSTWVRRRFLYPVVYYNVSMPTDDYVDTLLSFVVPEKGSDETRLALIKLLLNMEAISTESLAFKCYAALQCHPYDACELLLSHLELKFAAEGSVSDHEADIVFRIAEKIGSIRTKDVADLIKKRRGKFGRDIDVSHVRSRLSCNTETGEFIVKMLTMDCASERPSVPDSKLHMALANLRWSRYPTYEDFLEATVSARRWAFTQAGRGLSAIITSLYMVERREREVELRHLFRLKALCGQTTPYLFASPRGADALDRNLLPVEKLAQSAITAACDSAIADPDRYEDRAWIKSAHWWLRAAERNLKIGTWIEGVRRYLPIAPPPYLSGIDWRFVHRILELSRIEPFEGTASGVYVLFLMQLEDRNAEATPLRTAIEPFARGRSVDEFVDWLIKEFGEGATALVRFFLTAEHLLMLGLAPNQTAAVAERISALQQCVRRFKFGSLLRAEQFGDELRVLSSTLLLRNLGDEQFEVPWRSFQADAIELESERYEAYLAFKTNQAAASSLLTEAILEVPHRFRNGLVVKYQFTYSKWPLASLILAIIDAFVAHPSLGIEILLSNRFRHDTLRKEYSEVLDRVKASSIPWTGPEVQAQLIEDAEEPILLALQDWMDRRLQTRRPSRPDALFDFAPTQLELAGLVASIDEAGRMEAIVSGVIDWLRPRLEDQVKAARTAFEAEIPALLGDAIGRANEAASGSSRFRSVDIERVSAALRSGIDHRTVELANWFQTTNEAERTPLTFSDLKLSVDGLYERSITDKKLVTYLSDCPEAQFAVPAERVRLGFDLVSEIYRNALKHRLPDRAARVRIKFYAHDGLAGFVFSSLSSSDGEDQMLIQGARYESVYEEVFREGNSGLPKIAALAASLVGSDVIVRAVRRLRSFHLFVPVAGEADVRSA